MQIDKSDVELTKWNWPHVWFTPLSYKSAVIHFWELVTGFAEPNTTTELEY